MTKAKKNSGSRVKVQDLDAKKDPKGGGVALSDISITKVVDKASPTLATNTSTIHK